MATLNEVPETQRDMMLALPNRQVRMPRSLREVFGLLAYLSAAGGIEYLLDRIDFSDATPADISLAVFGRAPGEPAAAIPEPGYEARAHFRDAILSPEFRGRVMHNILTAFPDKGRDIFIHVPKCAGTDLIFNLATRGLPLPRMLELEGWLSDEEFLAAIGGICRIAPFHERFFVYGHMELGSYVYDAGVRAGDRIFTVIRDPLDQMLSQANYAIGRLRQDPTGSAPDTAEILQYLDIPRLPPEIGDRELKELACRALLHPEIAQPNRACTYLGRGMKGTYAAAIDRLVVHDVEITTTDLYERWLRERWNVGTSARHNRSDSILSRSDLRWLYADALRDRTAEDQKLFNTVAWALEQTGGASVTGMEIGRLAVGWLMDGVPPSAAAARTPDAGPLPQPTGHRQDRNLLVAEESPFVDRYLQAAPPVASGGPWIETLNVLSFGVDGSGSAHQLDGWSETEERFTWTNAPISRLRLPPLPAEDVCAFRLIGNPYVVDEPVPFQRIEVLLNGEYMGYAQIHDIAIIECEIPARMARAGEPVTLTLRLPTAARPMEISGSGDDRLLAFALHRLVLYRVHAGGAAP